MSEKNKHYVIRITKVESGEELYVKSYRWVDDEKNIEGGFTVGTRLEIEFTDSWRCAKFWKTKLGVDLASNNINGVNLKKVKYITKIVDMTNRKSREDKLKQLGVC